MKLLRSCVAGVALSVAASSAMALEDFDPSVFAAGADDQFNAMVKDFGAALSYKAITPAEPLGLLGIDLGIELSFTTLESADEWGAALGDSGADALPLPKLHVHKGLPFGIDLGVVYSEIPTTDIKYLGGEIRYSFVSGNIAIPAIAVRGTYTSLLGIDELELTTTGLELTVSKGFLMLTPYAGIGQIWVDGSLEYPVLASNPTGPKIRFSDDEQLFKWFVGLNFNLGLMNLVAEVDTTGDNLTYSGKVGFRF